ncbi:M15 family metallopeptidase [Brucepastera parasyntrophica]|uniref:M15 family metallopeptidase n=1 Tax=Brucepastera parasyntrophica TaxID=2880008 RepID=UPI00210BE87B|nr:M15 family metallopeptidase [Brucepastera parasyntrophica]ULQ60629.1 M15 family metallopeptidase [Brucepastera parasyntrophica]
MFRTVFAKIMYSAILVFAIFGTDLPPDNPGVHRSVPEKPWLILGTLKAAYPDKIQSIGFDPGKKDWFLQIDGTRLFWAGGRLLPARELYAAIKWQPHVDYLYPGQTPDPESLTQEQIERLKTAILNDNRGEHKVKYHPAFFELLYGGSTRIAIERHITRVNYLGKRVSVHRAIVAPLKRVEEALDRMAKTDDSVRRFIDSIASIDGYHWREIADRPVLSNHSWGIAIDILPKNHNTKNIYWNWNSTWNEDWMLLPLNRRWMPPAAVISAFEKKVLSGAGNGFTGIICILNTVPSSLLCSNGD